MAVPTQPEAVLAGHFRLGRQLPGGALGRTHQAIDTRSGRHVAVKVLGATSSSPAAFSRFAATATTVSELGLPGTARVLQASAPTDAPRFVVTEWLDGEDLASRLKRETSARLGWNLAVELIAQCAKTLAEVQRRAGIAHLDLKPTNCFLASSPGGTPLVKLLDFGLVHLDPGADGEVAQHTQTFSMEWENAYRAPEQIMGEPLDERTDIYALGAILFELLTGRPPFTGTHLEVGHHHVHQPLPSFTIACPGLEIPERVGALVRRALAKGPSERFSDMASFERELRATLPGAGEDEQATSVFPRPPKPADRTEQYTRPPRSAPAQNLTEQVPRPATNSPVDLAPTEVLQKPGRGPPLIRPAGEAPAPMPGPAPAPTPIAPPIISAPPPPVPIEPTIDSPRPRPRREKNGRASAFLRFLGDNLVLVAYIAGGVVLLIAVLYRYTST